MPLPGETVPQFWATASVRVSASPVKLSLKKYCPVRPVPDRYNRGSSISSFGRTNLLSVAAAHGCDASAAREGDGRDRRAGRLRNRCYDASRSHRVVVIPEVVSPSG